MFNWQDEYMDRCKSMSDNDLIDLYMVSVIGKKNAKNSKVASYNDECRRIVHNEMKFRRMVF